MNSFLLASLNEVQEKLLHYPSISISKVLKFLCCSFLCDGQGADRQAILSCDRSCLYILRSGGNVVDNMLNMPIHFLQCVFYVEKLFCTHRFFHKYEQTRTEKFAQALLLIPMLEVYLQRSMMLSKYSRKIQKVTARFRF